LRRVHNFIRQRGHNHQRCSQSASRHIDCGLVCAARATGGNRCFCSTVKLTVNSSIALERIVMSGADVVLADIDAPELAAAIIHLAEDCRGIGMVCW